MELFPFSFSDFIAAIDYHLPGSLEPGIAFRRTRCRLLAAIHVALMRVIAKDRKKIGVGTSPSMATLYGPDQETLAYITEPIDVASNDKEDEERIEFAEENVNAKKEIKSQVDLPVRTPVNGDSGASSPLSSAPSSDANSFNIEDEEMSEDEVEFDDRVVDDLPVLSPEEVKEMYSRASPLRWYHQAQYKEYTGTWAKRLALCIYEMSRLTKLVNGKNQDMTWVILGKLASSGFENPDAVESRYFRLSREERILILKWLVHICSDSVLLR